VSFLSHKFSIDIYIQSAYSNTMMYAQNTIVINSSFKDRIESILKEPTLNTSSRDFLKSLKEFVSIHNGLTKRQLRAFERIESAFSPQKKEQAKEWQDKYVKDLHMREMLTIAARYYSGTTYFHQNALKILQDPTFIPTEKQFDAMTGNKYARAVLEATLSTPKFPVKSLVYITNKLDRDVPRAFKPAYVIQTDSSPVTSAVKGGKKYKVLPFGTTRIIEVEERFLKKKQPKRKEENVSESANKLSN